MTPTPECYAKIELAGRTIYIAVEQLNCEAVCDPHGWASDPFSLFFTTRHKLTLTGTLTNMSDDEFRSASRVYTDLQSCPSPASSNVADPAATP
jgi:hypothetical protein